MNAATVSTAGYIAIPDLEKTAGAIVFWRLSGELDLEKLTNAWRAAGLDEDLLPASPSPLAALRRAVNEMRGADRIIRPIKGAHGFAVLDEVQRDGEFEYTRTLAVRVTSIGALRWDTASAADEELVTASYQRNLTSIMQSDVSAWFSDLMDEVSAVGLRDTGGIYFVPAFAIDEWSRMVNAIRCASAHVIASVPALRSDEAKTAFLDAISQEAEASIAGMREELDGTLGKRALESRVLRAEAVETKIAAYEDLLGGKLDTLRERVHTLRAELSAAAFKATPQMELAL